MSEQSFAEAVDEFKLACRRGEDFKQFYSGATYLTRLENAFDDIKAAYQAVRDADFRSQ